jgi:hypothetical protein
MTEIDAIRQKVRPHIERHEKLYPTEGDIRKDLLGIPTGTLLLQQLLIKAYYSSFGNTPWWNSMNIPIQDGERFARRFILFAQYYGFIHIFSNIESQFRRLTIKIDRNACENGNGRFTSVYNFCLTRTQLLNQYQPLFDFSNTVRNCVHHNGYFITRNTTDKIVNYRGTTYAFVRNQPINFFASSALVVGVLDDLFDCLVAMSQHTSVTSLQP